MNPRKPAEPPLEAYDLTEKELVDLIHEQYEKEIKPYLCPEPTPAPAPAPAQPSQSYLGSVMSYFTWSNKKSSNEKPVEEAEAEISHVHLSR